MNLSTFGMDPTPQVFHVVRAKMQIGSRRFTGKLIIHDNVNTEIVSPGIHKVTSMLVNKGINLADRHINGDKLRNVLPLQFSNFLPYVTRRGFSRDI